MKADERDTGTPKKGTEPLSPRWTAGGLHQERGSSTVEFALVVPLLILLVFGILEFGMAFGNQLAVTHAAREGARLAAVGNFDETSVRGRAYPVEPTAVTIAYPNGNNHGEPVEVTVDYDMTINIPFFGTRNVPLSSSAQMRLEV